MKDEEMADEYVKKEGFRSGMFGELDNITSSEANKEIKQAFFAGLKAGRPQWHDLRKDPTDLPKLDTNVLVIHRWARTPEVGKRTKVFISSSVWVWSMCSDRFRYTSDNNEVIAWCEIPTFDKE